MNINQEGYSRRMTFVHGILHKFGLTFKSTDIQPLAYVEHCPFHFNNFVYKVVLSSPAYPASFPPGQPGTWQPPLDGVSTLVIRLSNPLAEGLNNANRVENEVASLYLARQALEQAGVAPVVPAVYAWAPKSHGEHEEGFGWVVTEFKDGSDLDGQFPTLSLGDQVSVLGQIADVLAAIQQAKIPDGAIEYGGLTFVDGEIVSGQMTLMEAGPWATYSALWAAKLQAQLENSEKSPLLQGWAGDIRERLDRFLSDGAQGVDKVLEEVDGKQRVLVHGDLTMNNMLYDNTKKVITAVLDFDWASVVHPAEEFLSGLWDIGGGIHQNTEFMQDAILTGKFDGSPDLSGEDVQKWEIGKLWNEASAHKVTRPSEINGMRGVWELKRLEDMLCPFHLSNEVMLKRTTQEVQVKQKAENGEDIKRWLAGWGF